MATLSFNNVSKVFNDGFKLLDNLSFSISNQEFVVLIGPQGCGKSTLIRMIAGLESISSGDICIDNNSINNVSPHMRDVSIVFQSHLLYPNTTVYENIYYGLKYLNIDKEKIHQRIIEATNFLNLDTVLNCNVKKLDTCQKQRLNIARSIAKRPKLLLYDNLLENISSNLHCELHETIQKVHERYRITSIYVTSDQQEAISFSKPVVILNKSLIEQIDEPNQIYGKPASIFAAGFIGTPPMNLLPCSVDANGNIFDDKSLPLLLDNNKIPSCLYDRELYLGLRPENVQLHAPGIQLTIENIIIEGKEQLIYGRHGDTGLVARCPIVKQNKFPVQIGETIQFGTSSTNDWHWFDRETGLRINI